MGSFPSSPLLFDANVYGPVHEQLRQPVHALDSADVQSTDQRPGSRAAAAIKKAAEGKYRREWPRFLGR